MVVYGSAEIKESLEPALVSKEGVVVCFDNLRLGSPEREQVIEEGESGTPVILLSARRVPYWMEGNMTQREIMGMRHQWPNQHWLEFPCRIEEILARGK